jgi:hypothetical protein
MMGSLFVQPQRMQRVQAASPETLLVSELTSLVTRLLVDSQQGGQIGRVMQQAVEQSLRNLMQARIAAAQAAVPRLNDWLLRVLRALTGLGPDLRVGSPVEGIQLAHAIVSKLGTGCKNASVATIRPYVADILQIMQVDLGLGLPAIEGMIWGIVDDVIARLEAMPREPQRVARENRLDTIRMLRRFKKLVQGKVPLPIIDADRLTDAIMQGLRRINAPEIGEKITCVTQGVDSIVDAVEAIDALVPAGISSFRTLGAAAAASATGEQYCWYASWLRNTDVLINSTRTQITAGDQVIAMGLNLTLADIPEFRTSSSEHYTFQHVDIQAMESMAFAMYVIADGIDLVLHLFSLEKGDYASNAFNAFNFTFFGVVKLAAGKPMLPNAVETYVFPPITALLSFFTLLNYEGEFDTSVDPDPRPLNRKHIEGVVAIPGIIIGLTGAQMSPALYPRQDYGLSNGGLIAKTILFHDLLTNTLFSFGNRLLGCLLAMGVGRNFDLKAWGEGSWRLAVSFGTWFISQYMSKEGDTDGGKYNPMGTAFPGYPAHDASPYTLPYPSDTYYYCIQGNQGWFSHHSQNVQQTYSYDFSMDQGDFILASRPGTVVDYFDWVADDSDPGWDDLTAPNEATASGFLVPNQTRHDTWNFICIRHDVDDAGAAAGPDNVHDRGAANAAITTYAVYGHGRKDSVRELFGARGISANNIIGQIVRRGDRIMRAGNTGVSFNNHLHMMVHAGPAAPAAPADRLLPVKRNRDSSNPTYPHCELGTIPFVFKEVTHIIGTDGVCKSLNFYTSTTVDLQAPATP